jgi:hypothetical protein
MFTKKSVSLPLLDAQFACAAALIDRQYLQLMQQWRL